MKTLHLTFIPILLLSTMMQVSALQTMPGTSISNPPDIPKQIQFDTINNIMDSSESIITSHVNNLNYGITGIPIISIAGSQTLVQNSTTPLQQFRSGILAKDVVCKDKFVLAIRVEGHLPACVDPDSMPNLVLRGWATNPLSNYLDVGSSTQEQQNQFFYDIMNLSQLRAWSETGWRFIGGNHIEYGDRIHFSQLQLYLPSKSGDPKMSCNDGWHADVVIDTRKLAVINATYPIESDCGNQTGYVYRESGLQVKGPNEMVPNVIPSNTNVIHVQNSNFTISYAISGGKLDLAEFNKTRSSFIILLTASDDGDLTVTIPRALLDSGLHIEPYQFLVLVDGYPVRYLQSTSILDNTLTIPFDHGSAKIEITAE